MEVRIITLSYAIRTFYMYRAGHPHSLEESRRQLRRHVPFLQERRHFDVSYIDHGQSLGMATAEETYPGEAERLHGKIFSIEKGDYASILITDYIRSPQDIERAFAILLTYPNLDPKQYCIAFYLSDTEVQCMVKM